MALQQRRRFNPSIPLWDRPVMPGAQPAPGLPKAGEVALPPSHARRCEEVHIITAAPTLRFPRSPFATSLSPRRKRVSACQFQSHAKCHTNRLSCIYMHIFLPGECSQTSIQISDSFPYSVNSLLSNRGAVVLIADTLLSVGLSIM